MILATLRANAWKYACLLCAVLAVAACVGMVIFRSSAAALRVRADTAGARAQALEAALKREDASRQATDTARAAADARQPERQTRTARVEEAARAPHADPCRADPVLVRELEDGAALIRATEDRLRGYGPAPRAPAGGALR